MKLTDESPSRPSLAWTVTHNPAALWREQWRNLERWRSEWKPLAAILAVFLAIYLPLGMPSTPPSSGAGVSEVVCASTWCCASS